MATVNWVQFIKAAEEAGEELGEFTPIPAASYEAKVITSKVASFKDGKKEGWNVGFVIEGGPHAGRRVWTNLVISPESSKAMGMLLRQLQSLGVRPLLDAGASNEQIAGAMIDAPVTIKVTVGEYQGKPKNDVAGIASRQAGGPGDGAVPNFVSAPGLPI
jgi:uncharacterized protein DUF669